MEKVIQNSDIIITIDKNFLLYVERSNGETYYQDLVNLKQYDVLPDKVIESIYRKNGSWELATKANPGGSLMNETHLIESGFECVWRNDFIWRQELRLQKLNKKIAKYHKQLKVTSIVVSVLFSIFLMRLAYVDWSVFGTYTLVSFLASFVFHGIAGILLFLVLNSIIQNSLKS